MFDVNDVVFARLEGYPFWPARVIAPKSEHLTNLAMSNIPPHQRLVLFYNDGGRYAAMDSSDLRNFDDHHIQGRTLAYDGRYRAQLRQAFKEATEEHSIKPSSATNSPHRKGRPDKKSTPEFISPVAHQSEPRHSTTSKNTKHGTHQPRRTTSQPEIPSQTLRRKASGPPSLASRPHPDSSQSTHPSQSQYFSSQEHPTDKKPSSPQLEPSPSVQLRLRVKRNSAPLQSSSQSPEQPTHQSVPKRRRLVKADSSSVRSHPSPERSARQPHHHRPACHHPHPSDLKNQSAQPHQCRHKHISERLTSDANHHTRISEDPHRIPRLTSRKVPHRPDEKSQQTPNINPSLPKSRLRRNASKRADSEEIVPQPPDEHDFDQIHQSKKRKRSSSDGTGQPDKSDIDGEPRRKEMRPVSKRSLSSERPRRSSEMQGNSIGDCGVKDNGAEKGGENRTSIEPEKNTKPGTHLEHLSTPFDRLTKDECIDLIGQLQETVRQNNVELWRRGIRLAEEKEVLKTEEGLIDACSGAIQQAENVFKLMKSAGRENKRVLEKEAEAYEACNALRDVYFDLEKVGLQTLGNRVVTLVKEMRSYSINVSRVLMDVVVMWADLTGKSICKEGKDDKEREKKDSKMEEGSVPTKDDGEEKMSAGQKDDKDEKMSGQEDDKVAKRSPHKNEEDKNEEATEKKNLTREERLQKFDRKKCCEAMGHLFREEDGKALQLDEKEIVGITRRLEHEIRPRFEKDRVGYYGASAKVMKTLRKALRQIAAKGDQKGEKIVNPHASLLMEIVKHPNREKTKLFVSQLNSRK